MKSTASLLDLTELSSSRNKVWSKIGDGLEATRSGHYVDLRPVGDKRMVLFIALAPAQKLMGLSTSSAWTHIGGDLQGRQVEDDLFEIRFEGGTVIAMTKPTLQRVIELAKPASAA
jgi:hypothetical protein